MRAFVLAMVLCAACGARSELQGEHASAPIADVPTDAPRDAARDAPMDLGRPCGCPGTPGFQYCQLPRMCCPVTRTCEDPSRFNCSGSTPPPCR